MRTCTIPIVVTLVALKATVARSISLVAPGVLDTVLDNMVAISNHSWEFGTAAESLLEVQASRLSVFGNASMLHGNVSRATQGSNYTGVLDIVDRVLSVRKATTQTIIEDGSAGDPASLGVSLLLLNWTQTTNAKFDYGLVAAQQLETLLLRTPRDTVTGALSHRTEQVQVWSDNVYMVPPFLAYYGAVHSNLSLLLEAHHQISAYRQVLRDPSTDLWRHVMLGTWQDTSLWATGNAWAAAGTVRVLATYLNTVDPVRSQLKNQTAELATWAAELVGAAWARQDFRTGALHNYLDQPATFLDSSSTALFAAATYRLATLAPKDLPVGALAAADKARTYISSQIDASGWLQNVVDPLAFNKLGVHSPEGQAFVGLMEAAKVDYDAFIKEAAVTSSRL